MRASKPALLITGIGQSQEVHLVDVLDGEVIVAPLNWVLRRKVAGAILCTSSMTSATVGEVTAAGIAKPGELGVPLFSSFYVLTMLIGLFTLSIPARLQITLTNFRPLELSDLGNLLMAAVKQNPNHYTRASASDIEQLLVQAKTFAQMRKAFQ